ncbi:MAG: hypothetical protein J6A79_14945 [Clostridia bacterium]|nr:hypothetical protein [Clostridia bacterium]
MNTDDLREALRNCLGTAMQGFPVAMLELSEVDSMSDEELIQKALGFGLLSEEKTCDD